MSAEHRRPLLAFVVVSILCAVMLGQGIRSHAEIGPLGIPQPASAAPSGTASVLDTAPSLVPVTTEPSAPVTITRQLPRRARATAAEPKDRVLPTAATGQGAGASVSTFPVTQSPVPPSPVTPSPVPDLTAAPVVTAPAPAQEPATASVPAAPAKPERSSGDGEQVSAVVVRDRVQDTERAAEAAERASRDAEQARAAAKSSEEHGEGMVEEAAEKAAEDAARVQEAAAEAWEVLARTVRDESPVSEGKPNVGGLAKPNGIGSLGDGSPEAH